MKLIDTSKFIDFGNDALDRFTEFESESLIDCNHLEDYLEDCFSYFVIVNDIKI